jgi:hypothetical protein
MYRIFDISLDCDFPLPELPKAKDAGTILHIQRGSIDTREAQDPAWFHEWKDANGDITIICGRAGDDYLLQFPDLVVFLISHTGDRIICFPEPDVPEDTIRHLLIDQVIPRVLGQMGQLVLHASAVQLYNGTGIIFLGDTGWGKSTIASSFHKNGARLITDDCLLIKIVKSNIYCVPNYYGLRLYPDSSEAIFETNMQYEPVAHYSGKKRVVLSDIDNKPDGPVPVSAIFLLSDPGEDNPDTVSVEKIHGADELMTILGQIFLVDVTDKQLIKKQFRNASDVVATAPAIFKLSYPRNHAMLNDVRRAVENAVTDTRAIC